jgi:hypothetical protein
MRDEEFTTSEKVGLGIVALGLAVIAGAAGGAVMWWLV